MSQKAQRQIVPSSRTLTFAHALEVTENYDTEFEEDVSDTDEYSGRRSEDSVCCL